MRAKRKSARGQGEGLGVRMMKHQYSSRLFKAIKPGCILGDTKCRGNLDPDVVLFHGDTILTVVVKQIPLFTFS